MDVLCGKSIRRKAGPPGMVLVASWDESLCPRDRAEAFVMLERVVDLFSDGERDVRYLLGRDEVDGLKAVDYSVRCRKKGTGYRLAGRDLFVSTDSPMLTKAVALTEGFLASLDYDAARELGEREWDFCASDWKFRLTRKRRMKLCADADDFEPRGLEATMREVYSGEYFPCESQSIYDAVKEGRV